MSAASIALLSGSSIAGLALAAWLAVRYRDLKQELETSRTARRFLLSSLSHELRTPLNAVVGYGNLLKQSDLQQDQQDMVNASIDAGNHLLELIDGMLFAMGAKNKEQLLADRKNFAPNEVGQQLVKMLRPLALEQQIGLSIASQLSEHEQLFGNAALYRGALRILIENAIRHTSTGEVKVTLDCLVRNDVRYLEATVSDTGEGISDERRNALSDAFNAAQSASGNDDNLFEIGLPLLGRFIHAAGGFIDVRARSDKGSVFKVGLPVEDPRLSGSPHNKIEADDPGAAPRLPGPLRVLVVDDNQTNRNLLSNILKRTGHIVALASDGIEALEQLDTTDFDAVLLDVNMPRMTGTEMCRHWRAREKQNNRIPIIGITADATAETRRECLDSGMDEYLTKPVDSVMLHRIMEQLCRPASCRNLVGSGREKSKDVSLFHKKQPERTRAAAIDQAQIDYLFSIGDAEFMREMISGFFEDVEDILPTLRAAAAQGDAGKFRLCAHALKSSANNLGALMMATLCHEYETIDEKSFLSASEECLAKMEAVIEDAAADLTELMEGLDVNPDRVGSASV